MLSVRRLLPVLALGCALWPGLVHGQSEPAAEPDAADTPTEPRSPQGPSEAEPTQPGTPEAGPTEAGPAEAGPAEAGPAEAGPAEAGPAERLPPTQRAVVPDHQRVAVVLLPRGAASPEMTDSLTELLIAAIAARGATDIIGKEEFQAALGRDDAGTLACIESDACVGRMGRELRVHELVAGTLHPARTPDGAERFRFELYRLDAQSGTAVGRVAREVDGGLGALLAALTASIDELYVERVEPGAIVVEMTPRSASLSLDDVALERTPDGAFRRDYVVPGAHHLAARASGYEPLSRDISIEPGTTLMLSIELFPRSEQLSIHPTTYALGGVGLALLGVAIGLGVSSQSLPDPALTLGMRQTQSFFDARQTEADAANAFFVLGGAGLVAALVSLVLDLGTSSNDAPQRAMRGEVARW